jgi:hypothetical protein
MNFPARINLAQIAFILPVDPPPPPTPPPPPMTGCTGLGDWCNTGDVVCIKGQSGDAGLITVTKAVSPLPGGCSEVGRMRTSLIHRPSQRCVFGVHLRARVQSMRSRDNGWASQQALSFVHLRGALEHRYMAAVMIDFSATPSLCSVLCLCTLICLFGVAASSACARAPCVVKSCASTTPGRLVFFVR